MRALLSTLWSLLLCALCASGVLAGESDYLHAIELIYMYSHYRLEGVSFANERPDDAFIRGCRATTARCGFNEFIYYIATGNRGGNPPNYIAHTGFLDVTNKADVENAANAIVKAGHAPERIVPTRVIPVNKGSGGGGFLALYSKLEQVQNRAKTEASKPGRDKALTDFNSLQPAIRGMRGLIISLRRGVSQAGLLNELKSVFPSADNKADIYNKPGGGKYAAIQWKTGTMSSKNYVVPNLPATETANPQILEDNENLKNKIKQRIAMFWADDKSLVHYDATRPNVNGNHKAVFERLEDIAKRCG